MVRLLILGGVLLLAGCEQPQPSKLETPPPVQIQIAQRERVAEHFSLPGEIRARQEVPLAFRVAGKIVSREVDVGQTIVPGQILLRLDPADYRLAVQAQEAIVAASESEVRLARTEDERVRELRGRNLLAQSDADKSRTALEASQARLAAAKAQLAQQRHQTGYATLTAETAGVITAVSAEEGQVVSAGQQVLRIAQAGAREVLVHVPERRLHAFTQAAALRIQTPLEPATIWPGQLRELAQQADPATRSFAARISLPSQSDAWPLGGSAEIEVALPERDVWLLPLTALHTQRDVPAIWVMHPETHRVTRIEVATAGRYGERVMVNDGLRGGEHIVSAGGHRLHEGQQVLPLDARP
ncbi:MAG: efflux RND transporter periplasmic adaptor subunit [Thiotrichales bacterium]